MVKKGWWVGREVTTEKKPQISSASDVMKLRSVNNADALHFALGTFSGVLIRLNDEILCSKAMRCIFCFLKKG